MIDKNIQIRHKKDLKTGFLTAYAIQNNFDITNKRIGFFINSIDRINIERFIYQIIDGNIDPDINIIYQNIMYNIKKDYSSLFLKLKENSELKIIFDEIQKILDSKN